MPYKNKQKRYDAIRKSVAKKPEHYKVLNRNNQKKDTRKDYMLKRLYGISLKQYKGIEERQGGKCAICEKPPKNTRSWHLDHNHKTRKVRGLLCASCNRSVAALDNIEWLEKAMVYLEKNS